MSLDCVSLTLGGLCAGAIGLIVWCVVDERRGLHEMARIARELDADGETLRRLQMDMAARSANWWRP